MSTAFLECPICFGLLRNAVETDCGHCFCADCLSRVRKNDNSCPSCRKPVQFVHPSFIIRDLVAKYGGSDGREKLEADAVAQKERDADVEEHEDPLIIAMQFKKWTDCCCGGGSGAFDPEDVHGRESLEEYLTADGFHDTLDKLNRAIRTWTPGFCSTSLAWCLWPCCCCCTLFFFAEYAVWKVEVALKAANEAAARAQMGHVWCLMHMDGEDREAGVIDHRFFLVLTIDPVKARKYMKTLAHAPVESTGQAPGSAEEVEAARRLAAEKDAEIQRLKRENEMISSRLLERGLKLVRSVSGQIVSPVFRTATRPSTPHRVRSPFSGGSSREGDVASAFGGSPPSSRLANVDESAVLDDDVAAATTVGSPTADGQDPASTSALASEPAATSGDRRGSGSSSGVAARPPFAPGLDLPHISLPRVRVLRASSRRGTMTSPLGELSPTARGAALEAAASTRLAQFMQEAPVQHMAPRVEAAPEPSTEPPHAEAAAEPLPEPSRAKPAAEQPQQPPRAVDEVELALALAGRGNVNGEFVTRHV